MTLEQVRRTAGSLVRACHPVPTVAVATLTTMLAAVVGVGWPRIGVLAAAVLTGQLSIGWLNDLVDRHRDRAAHRGDKPVASSLVSVRTVRACIVAATVVCVPLSLALGLAAGVAHLVAVAGAWSYNLGLKRTVWSWAPFALGFGLLPVIVGFASPAAAPPPAWLIGAAALLGVGAHGANVLPDLVDDRRAGVLGLPHRLPARVLSAATAVVLFAALALLTFGPGDGGLPTGWKLAILGPTTALAALGGGLGSSWLPARAPFIAVVGVAGLAVVVLIVRAGIG